MLWRAGLKRVSMISRTLFRPVEATVPPVPVTWKKSPSANSHASVVWATNTVSSERYSRRRPCTTQKKKVLASLRSRSDMLPETSSMKNTTAWTAGCRRRASCRKRRSSSVKVCGPPRAWRFTSSFTERRRSSRERAPRRSQPSRTQSLSSEGPTRAFRFGSCISSHSQSTMSSILISSISWMPPSSWPPAPFSEPSIRTAIGQHIARFRLALAHAL